MSWVARSVVFSFLSLAITVPPLPAQEAQDPKAAPTTQKPDKEQRRKIKKTLKELETPYKQWLNEDVVYIISPEERQAFLQLETNEEREQFIEQFWLRRSGNPDLPDNDFKEEHYRRIAYANEHFASGIPGWKTDRGRMYIMWGPADEVESHPTGGTYDRPMEEGGGSTSTYPWETWRYRYMEGIGENVIWEFVDPSGSGEYRLNIVIKDVKSGNVGVVNTRLQVPRYGDEFLEASSLILADQLEHVPAKQIGTGQFVLGCSKVRPKLDGEFPSDIKLGIYMQVYNLKPDEKTHKSNATFQYTVKKGNEQVMRFKETSDEMKQTGDQVTIERLLPLTTLTPGKYSLEVVATDTLANKTVSKTAEFTVKAPVETKTAAIAGAPGR